MQVKKLNNIFKLLLSHFVSFKCQINSD